MPGVSGIEEYELGGEAVMGARFRSLRGKYAAPQDRRFAAAPRARGARKDWRTEGTTRSWKDGLRLAPHER